MTKKMGYLLVGAGSKIYMSTFSGDDEETHPYPPAVLIGRCEAKR